MRIGGYGDGSYRQGGGARDRAASFRARHSIGQRVTGRILRREPGGLYWVQVGGEELLARLEVQAEPGAQLLFVVRALTPEIMLQALPGGAGAADLPGLVQRFRAAREVFEVQDAGLFQSLHGLPPQPQLRAEAFREASENDDATAQRLSATLQLLAQINAAREASEMRLAVYEPWLLPSCRRLEALREMAGGLLLSANHAAPGDFEAHITPEGDACKLLLRAQRPGACGALLVELAALVRGLFAVEPLVLGPTVLRPNALGGVLGALFGAVPGWSSGGLNTRV